MKKSLLLLMALATFIVSQAQWVNDPASNTFIANTSADACEIYLSTDPVSGNTYMQWSQFASNGWVPKVQRLNFAGEPQWDASGLQPASQYTLPSWSKGFAMVATSDGGMVSCFSTKAGQSVAVKINADGTYPWGEAGVVLFNGLGGSRVELLAGDDGGVWALATDITFSYLCYIYPNGTTQANITIADDGGWNCTFGQLVPAPDGNVFVVYEKEQYAYTYFYEKDVRVVGYRKDGTQFANDVQLMAPVTIPGSYIHHVVPDGLGGGYVYIWHPAGLGGTHNTYVFHFNQNGAPTILETTGVPVHELDPNNLYLDAYATVDPDSHDLLIAYRQTDAAYQAESKIYINRITASGEKLWGDGLLVIDNGTMHLGNIHIDAYEYGGGFSVIYHQDANSNIEAKGYDMEGNNTWNTTMSSSTYNKTGDENSTGFHGGQNIVAWVNSSTGGLYGQNIGQDGSMGQMIPPTPPAPCDPPTNFKGEYYYYEEVFGARLEWEAPETTPLHYNLYVNSLKEVIEIGPEYTSWMESLDPGDYEFRLTAVYEDCESDYALTPEGEDYVFFTVTSLDEQTDGETVGDGKIYTIDGRCLGTTLPDSFRGMYFQNGKKYVRF